MTNILDELIEFENKTYNEDYIYKLTDSKILITASHTMEQKRSDGTVKFREPFTKAIALYLNKYFNTNYLVKINDTGIDSNRFVENDEYKNKLIDILNNHHIDLVIDLHGSSYNRSFDAEFGTLDGVTISQEKVEQLTKVLKKYGIKNIAYNDPFKGGAITETVYNSQKAEAIQIEINAHYRNCDEKDKMISLCAALGEFIKTYKKE